jgi:hypothetical protein
MFSCSYTFQSFCDLLMLTCMEIGHALRRQTAGQFGPDLAKKLSQLVKMEKNVMRSMELVGRERMEVAVSYALWRS